MDKEEIIQEVKEIVKKITGRCVEKEYYAENLFSNRIGIKPFELVYIFFELEKSFQITFLAQEVIDEEFVSIARISELVNKKTRSVAGERNE